jgi:AcrR family transcriptional regulator
VADAVKGDRRIARRADTERRLVDAATRLFITEGYARTTLVAVAEAAGVAPRTVYTRFESKAHLLQRCLDVAIGGVDQVRPVDDDGWVGAAMSAPTAAERIALMARATADLMDRTGALLGVAQQAEATEPAIAARAQAGRLDTQRVLEGFWRRMESDGLLSPDVDIDWLAVTGATLGQAETYLTLAKVTHWDADTYAAWLETTWAHLAGIR